MLTRDEILKILVEHRNDINQFSVREIALFGSHVRNEAVGGSDMDFLVVFEKKSFDAYMNLKFYLEDLFACKVDVVIKESIKPRLKKTILAEAVYAEGF